MLVRPSLASILGDRHNLLPLHRSHPQRGSPYRFEIHKVVPLNADHAAHLHGSRHTTLSYQQQATFMSCRFKNTLRIIPLVLTYICVYSGLPVGSCRGFRRLRLTGVVSGNVWLLPWQFPGRTSLTDCSVQMICLSFLTTILWPNSRCFGGEGSPHTVVRLLRSTVDDGPTRAWQIQHCSRAASLIAGV